MKDNTPTKLKPYVFHAVDLTWNKSSEEATGECPFCGKENHFYVNKKSGQFNCKVCSESGNAYSFLAKLVDYSRKATKREDFVELSEERNVPPEALEAWHCCRSIVDGTWLIPQYNAKGKVANVCRAYKDAEGRWRVFGTSGCKLHPFGLHLVNGKQTRRHVLEGPWDGMAFWAVLSGIRKRGTRYVKTKDVKQSLAATEAVIAVPGSGNFNEDWFEHLDGEETRLYFDNDHPKKHPTSGKTTKPGWDGMERIVKLAGNSKQHPFRVVSHQMGTGRI